MYASSDLICGYCIARSVEPMPPGASRRAPRERLRQAVHGGVLMAGRSTTERGYGSAHQRERAKWKPIVDAGQANCWRCGRWLNPLLPWDLGHDDHDRSRYRGPECLPCNRATKTRLRARPRPTWTL